MLLNFIMCAGQQAVENGVVALTEGGRLQGQFEASDAVLFKAEGPQRHGVLRRMPILMQTLRRFRPHIIQGWMYHGNLAALMISTIYPHKTPVVWNIRHSLHQVRLEKKTTLAVNMAGAMLSFLPKKIIYNSQVSRRQHEQLGYARRRGTTIPNGFDLNRYQPDAQAIQRLQQCFDLPSDVLLVGHIARYHPMKDHANFLHAAAEVVQNFAGVRFLMAGNGVTLDNPGLSAVIHHLNLQDYVIMLGEREEMAPIFAGLDCLVLSSAWGEAFPNVIGEAMACGTPCIATKIGDCASIIRDSGYTVPPGDPSTLASAIVRLLSMPRDVRKGLGHRARMLIKKNFSIESIVEKYLTVYESIIDTQ